jgi:ankyrin repeat protein
MGWTGLHWAVSLQRTNCLRLLLDRKADVTSADKDGWTPLHVAALMGRVDECQTLLNAGANRKTKDKLGRTPLDLAKRSTAEKAAEVAALLGG